MADVRSWYFDPAFLWIPVFLILSGCENLQERAEEALDTIADPEEREVHYLREGNTIHYLRRECAGRFCE